MHLEWIDAQPLETLFLSSITVAELRAGVALLPAGKRRTGLQQGLESACFHCSPAVCCPSTWPAPKRMHN
ncbi:putative ribonuclease FitB [Variovorax sp. RA8]|nr:putative ribonuclease FitB [Variovorax sp. RA8]